MNIVILNVTNIFSVTYFTRIVEKNFCGPSFEEFSLTSGSQFA